MDIILKKGIVSVIVPCYNGEFYLGRLLECLYMQTYKNIQLIFVNDGSTDETEKIFKSYIKKFKERKIEYIYIHQENRGQAGAINTALEHVTGEYLMWIDADDFITDDHIKQKIDCLNKNSECAIVRCQGVIVDETDTKLIKGYLNNDNIIGTAFENILFEFSACTGGLYMVRTRALFNVLSNHRIYPSRTGQNFQLLLPILYEYKICYLDNVLFFYVERRESHSHNFHSITEWYVRLNDIKNLKLHILSEIYSLMNKEYMDFLISQIYLLDIYQKMDMIINVSYGQNEEKYIKIIIMQFAHYLKQKSCNTECWIWGASEKNFRLVEYLKEYLEIKIVGFIDSDKNKQDGKQVISPDMITPTKMYIIILLQYHQEIVDELCMHGFTYYVNYVYPKYELIKNLKDRGDSQK